MFVSGTDPALSNIHGVLPGPSGDRWDSGKKACKVFGKVWGELVGHAVAWFGKYVWGELVAHIVAWFGNALFQAGTSSDATKGIVVSQ